MGEQGASSHTAWNELVAAALIGGEREAVRLPDEGPLGEVLSRLECPSREQQLLGAAAILSLYRRAGARPAVETAPPPEPSPAESLSRCPSSVGRYLAEILSGTRAELLSEWLDAAAAAGMRAPEELLPALLDLGAAREGIREKLLPVLGERGRWLARHNPDWAYALGPEEAIDWETAPRVARLALLKRLRATDPARARELLQSTWEQDPPNERAAFIAHLDVGLSMEDEPFLEAALDDKRKEVRTQAAELLAKLPQSRLSARMLERVRPLLSFTPGQPSRVLAFMPGKKPSLQVTLPEACDRAMARDGIEAKPPPGMGKKAFWLMQMIAVIPPATWCEMWGTPPQVLIEAARETEHHRELLEGWARAAVRHGDPEWAEALLSASIPSLPEGVAAELVDPLPPERREAALLPHIQADGDRLRLVPLLMRCRHAWSETFTRAVLALMREHTQRAGHLFDWRIHSALKQFAHYAAPTLADEAARMLGASPEAMRQGSVEQFLDLLHSRRQMLAAFSDKETR
ncbi:MAG TPA: hypothetical protein GX715_11400 [Armatimonadetes bacterium]|nr:hypothetical protein [Armatimonadota bacterium]